MSYNKNIENAIILPRINNTTSQSYHTKSNTYNEESYDDKRKNNSPQINSSLTPFDYAEAFNQINNAKFLVQSRIEKLKNEQNRHIMKNTPHKEQANGFDENEINENFNQVYNYLNPKKKKKDYYDYDNSNSNFHENNNRNINNFNRQSYPYYNQIPQFPNNLYNNDFNNFYNPFPNYPIIPLDYNTQNLLYGNNQNFSQNQYNNPNRGLIFPKILMGMPVNPDGTKKSKKRNLSNQEVLNALKNLLNKNMEENEQIEPYNESDKDEEDRIENKGNENKTYIKQKNDKNDPMKNDIKNKTKKNQEKNINTDNLWILLRDFTHMSIFFNIAKSNGKNALIRIKEISDFDNVYSKYMEVLKKWQIQIQLNLWNEFKKADVNLSFSNSTPKPKFQENSQKIIAFVNLYIKNLLAKSTKNVDIPDVILQIMFKFIKNKSYFPREFLTNYEINRLEFTFEGGIKNLNENVMGMLLSNLIICKSTIKQIFLKPLVNIEQIKTFKNIEITMKFISTVLNYIVEETYSTLCQNFKNKIILFNYFRNYKVNNNDIEKEKNNLITSTGDNYNINNIFELNDRNNMNGLLLDDNIFKEFIQVNKNWIEAVKKYILQWSIGLAKYIKLKFEK